MQFNQSAETELVNAAIRMGIKAISKAAKIALAKDPDISLKEFMEKLNSLNSLLGSRSLSE